MDNPWQVESIEAFAYLKCPECQFDTKEEYVFENHAVKNHPLSYVLFEKPNKDNDPSVKVYRFNPNDIDKLIDEKASNESPIIKKELNTNFEDSNSFLENESNFDVEGE